MGRTPERHCWGGQVILALLGGSLGCGAFSAVRSQRLQIAMAPVGLGFLICKMTGPVCQSSCLPAAMS